MGIPALEDKIVQGAVAEVLSALYEADFAGFSYGFRPGRSPHQALTALHKALMTQYVNWVLDADIRRFFDSVDHELGLVRRWLRAGVLEGTEWHETEQGTPQGAGISPLLANIFLHHVLDQWIHDWRQRDARGRISIVRYADDFIVGCQYEADARRVWAALRERLAQFGLTLHEDKTRLIEFGRLPAERRRRCGERRPETFAFLGFTHYCGWTRDGRFVVKRRTEGRRLTRKLHELRAELWRRMHAPVATQRARLVSVLRGHYAYYGLPSNWHRLGSFYDAVRRSRSPTPKAAESNVGGLHGPGSPLPLTSASDHSPADSPGDTPWDTLRRSRVRESRTLGSVRAKAEWLSYSTTTPAHAEVRQGDL